MRCAGGATYLIVGTDSLEIHHDLGRREVTVRLVQVGHVSGHSYHLMPLWLITDASNCFIGTSKGITIKVSVSGEELFSPCTKQVNYLYGYSIDQTSEQG